MPTISDQRRETASRMRERLPSAFATVLAPDHPLLLRGPDVLVGGEGVLTAVYIPGVVERERSQDNLRTRYILSRLALPPHTRHVLAWSPDWAGGLPADLLSSFAEVLEPTATPSLVKIAQDREFVGRQKRVPPRELETARVRYSDALLVNKAVRRTRRHDKDVAPFELQTTGRSRRRPELIDIHPTAETVTTYYFSEGLATAEFVQSLLSRTVPKSQPLIEGTPALRGSPFDVALLDHLVEPRGDPDKILRAAAFAGWVLLDDDLRDLGTAVAYGLDKRWANR